MNKTHPTDLSPAEREKIIDFLTTHPVGVLASVSTDGGPHASTIYFSVNDDLSVTFTTKQDTFKYRNLSENSDVMLVVFDAAQQASVQISGRAKEETDPQAAHKIYQGTLRAAKGTGEDIVPPIAKISAGPYVAFTIHPDDVHLSEYGWGDNFAHALKHAADPEQSGDPA